MSNKESKYDYFLDIGCGMGRPSFFATRYYPQIKEFIGIDISKKMVEQSQKNLKSFNNRNNVPEKI